MKFRNTYTVRGTYLHGVALAALGLENLGSLGDVTHVDLKGQRGGEEGVQRGEREMEDC